MLSPPTAQTNSTAMETGDAGPDEQRPTDAELDQVLGMEQRIPRQVVREVDDAGVEAPSFLEGQG